MSGNPTPERREHSHPSSEMEAWFRLAADYERAGLGSDITPQTEQALQQMVTFLMQPAQCYTPVLRREDSDTARLRTLLDAIGDGSPTWLYLLATDCDNRNEYGWGSALRRIADAAAVPSGDEEDR